MWVSVIVESVFGIRKCLVWLYVATVVEYFFSKYKDKHASLYKYYLHRFVVIPRRIYYFCSIFTRLQIKFHWKSVLQANVGIAWRMLEITTNYHNKYLYKLRFNVTDSIDYSISPFCFVLACSSYFSYCSLVRMVFVLLYT